MKLLFVATFYLFFLIADIHAVGTAQCKIYFGSKTHADTALVTDVKIDPCHMKHGMCRLVKNENPTISFKFTPKYNTSAVHVKVSGQVLIWINLPLENTDGCDNRGLKCENGGLVENVEQTFKLSLPVHSNYPNLELTVSIELQDENSENIVCFMFPTSIINGKK